MKVAWVFPGQGSQKIGMAKQIENLPNTKERFSYASEIFERNLFEICELNTQSTNPLCDLNDTRNTQICLFLVESILLDALKDNGFEPNIVAGHSLGEITALYCADVFSFEDCDTQSSNEKTSAQYNAVISPRLCPATMLGLKPLSFKASNRIDSTKNRQICVFLVSFRSLKLLVD